MRLESFLTPLKALNCHCRDIQSYGCLRTMQQTPYSPNDPSVPQTNTLALVSLISGILGWVILPCIGGVVAVITGHMARKELRAPGNRLSGDGFATAGLILGWSQIGITILAGIVIFIALTFFSVSASSLYNNSEMWVTPVPGR